MSGPSARAVERARHEALEIAEIGAIIDGDAPYDALLARAGVYTRFLLGEPFAESEARDIIRARAAFLRRAHSWSVTAKAVAGGANRLITFLSGEDGP